MSNPAEPTTAMSALLDQLLIESPYTLSVFLDENREDFDEFVICGHAGGAV